jgi:tRNA pseudouridine55 synthase
VHDLGQSLGCGAHLTALRRTASGNFDVSQAASQQDLREAFAAANWQRYLLPIGAGLPHWPTVQLDSGAAARIANGQPVAAGAPASAGDNQLALGLGPDGNAMAVLELDAGAGAWRPKKVLVES